MVKAFNTIPRAPVFHAASCVGLPPSLIQAWSSFLDGLRRSFTVRGELSDSVSSCTGYPEGDALSTVAMALVDWCWHLYMSRFAPRAVPLYFVDNFTRTAVCPADLAQALNQTRCFAEMWGLELDHSKTFAWALDKGSRSTFQVLGLSVVDHANQEGLTSLIYKAGQHIRPVRVIRPVAENGWVARSRNQQLNCFHTWY